MRKIKSRNKKERNKTRKGRKSEKDICMNEKMKEESQKKTPARMQKEIKKKEKMTEVRKKEREKTFMSVLYFDQPLRAAHSKTLV